MIKLRPLRCSFCRKSEGEVSKLVAGPRVYICDQCVAIASRIMADSPDDNPPAPAGPAVFRRLARFVGQLLRRGDSRRVGSFSVSG